MDRIGKKEGKAIFSLYPVHPAHPEKNNSFFASLRLCAFALNCRLSYCRLFLVLFVFLVFSLWFQLSLFAAEGLSEEGLFAEGIVVDLREPAYCEGVLSTTQGGIIQGPSLRIQARNIRYTRKAVEGKPVCCIEADTDLIIEIGDYVFIGRELEYDFQTKTGTIYEGRTGVEPWFFGGERIDLLSDGSYVIYEGFATTSENVDSEWKIGSAYAHLEDKSLLTAKGVRFEVLHVPLLKVPSLHLNLKTIYDSPIKYRFSWGGRQGTRVGLTYEVFSWERWKTFLRLDYNLKRGPGGGVEAYYLSDDHVSYFHTINYIACDDSLADFHEQTRYRLQGLYKDLFFDERVSIELTWDKISDIDMPSDYYDKGIELDTAEKTQLHLRNQEKNWMTNFWTRVRVNNFQTIKQELPSIETRYRPITFGSSGIISDSVFKASYLDFEYTDHLKDVSDYASSRLELRPRFYRPIVAGPVTVTPEAGGVGVYYGNSPRHKEQFLAVGTFGCTVNTHLYSYYDWGKHIIEPYVNYTYYTFPTVNPNDHYIFDITDGWYRVSMLTYGFRNLVLAKTSPLSLARTLSVNLFARTFFDTPTFKEATPKVYAEISYFLSPRVKHTIDTAWDFEENRLDHFNIRADWTLGQNCAIGMEYRYRDAFCWRKVDDANFVLDSFRSIRELRASTLSDRRDTILFHYFYRFHPNWVIEMKSMNGWNRHHEPSYIEYEIDLVTTLTSGWRIKCSYQHYENDDRIAFYLSLGLQKPNPKRERNLLNYFE